MNWPGGCLRLRATYMKIIVKYIRVQISPSVLIDDTLLYEFVRVFSMQSITVST